MGDVLAAGRPLPCGDQSAIVAATANIPNRVILRTAAISTYLSCHIDHCLIKSSRRFLRQVVTDVAGDQAMAVPPGEFLGVTRGVRMRGAVCIAFQGNG